MSQRPYLVALLISFGALGVLVVPHVARAQTKLAPTASRPNKGTAPMQEASASEINATHSPTGPVKKEDVAPPTSELQSLRESLKERSKSINKLRQRYSQTNGITRTLLHPRFIRERENYRRLLTRGTAALLTPETSGSAEEKSQTEKLLSRLLLGEVVVVREEFRALRTLILRKIALVDQAQPEELEEAQQARNESLEDSILLVNEFDAILSARNKLGYNTKGDSARLEKTILNSSTLTSGLLLDISEDIATFTQRSPEEQDKSAAKLDALEQFLDVLIKFQRNNIRLLKERGLETSELRQGLIQATGKISRDILDAGVAQGLLEKAKGRVQEWLLATGPLLTFRAATFFGILLFFWLMGRIMRMIMGQILRVSSSRKSSLARDFLVKMTGRLFFVIGVFLALRQLGVQIAPLLAGLGVAGFVLGFALQNTLSNFASGLMILFYRPFDVDDVVEAGGVKGTVREMNLVSTSIVTFDNQMLVVPNNKVWGEVICNLTHQKERRVDMLFSIGRSDDVEKAQRVLQEIVENNELVLHDPAPIVRLHKIHAASLEFVLRPWVKTPNYWTAYWEVTREVQRRFDEAGFDIPASQNDVRVLKN